MNYFKRRWEAFDFAVKGLKSFFLEEDHPKVHLIASFLVISAGIFFDINKAEWVAVVLCIGFVLSAEAVNSALEKLTDIASPGFNKKAGQVKNIAAGAVLLAALASVAVGCLIFVPRILYFL